MTRRNAFLLLLLAAIWGASFLFLRVVAPALGPVWTAEARVGIAGLAMAAFACTTRQSLDARRHWKSWIVLGLFSCAIPFCLFAYAALTLPSGYLAIVNATTPLWGALIAAIWLDEPLTRRKAAGLVTGIAGVGLLVRLGPVSLTPPVVFAVLACAGAALSYAVSGGIVKKITSRQSAAQMATGSQLGAAVLLLPLLPLSPLPGVPSNEVIAAFLALALLCSAFAYGIFFRLIAAIGPTRAMTVTFLIPLFALIWGALFLNEPVTKNMLAGCALVAVAVWLVVFAPTKTTSQKCNGNALKAGENGSGTAP